MPPAAGVGGDGGTASTAGAAGGSGGGSGSGGSTAPPDGPCNLSGRWLVTLRYVVDGLGLLQTVHNWIYYEIEPARRCVPRQEGSALR